MSNISELTNNNSKVYESNTSKTANYGKTIGKAQLSEEGAKYYEELKKKYSNMDFVLVSSDMKDYAKQHASSYGNANKMVVLIDEEKIERMATDENFRAKYEGLISKAQTQMPQLKNIMQSKGNVKTIGMQVNDNGTASFFAVMQKSSKSISEKVAAKRAEKKKAEKAAEKKAAKKEQQEKIQGKGKYKNDIEDEEDDEDYVILEAGSIDELLKKIDNYNFNLRADSVQTPAEKAVGQTIDFKG